MEKIEDLSKVVGGDKPIKLDHLIIRSDLCTKCNVCADYCTEHAIEVINGVYKINDGRCTRCRACIVTCPVNAIRGL